MKRSIALIYAAAAVWTGCASDSSKAPRPERGPGGTISYSVQVEASNPGVKIEAGGEYVGTAPLTLKIFGDKDGTFHNFGNYSYVVRALPTEPGQFAQEKTYRTGGWFTPEDRIPSRIFFEMNLKPAGIGNRNPAPDPAETQPGRIRTSGTGFFITDDGYFITNEHVVRKGRRYEIAIAGVKVNAVLVRKDKSADLALLKADVTSVGLPLAENNDAKVGQQIYSLGYPLTEIMGEEPKFTTGMINALKGHEDDSSRFQFSAQVTWGNSGGPLVNDAGNVVGVVVSGLLIGQNVNYAIKTSRLRTFVEDEQGVRLKSPAKDKRMNSEELFSYLRPSVVQVLVE